MVERAKSGPQIVLYFLAAGFLIPCLIYSVMSLGAQVQEWILLVLWPTKILLILALNTSETVAFLISAVANMVVYSLLGVVVSFCYRRFRSRRAG